jgi:RimJ/RimL family protein N-acetyltransferase
LLGADIHKEHRGKGYAATMWSVMLNECFNFLNLHRVALTTAEYNNVGIHVYEKIGFKFEGKLRQSLYRDGKYYDQLCYYMLKEWWQNEKQ